LWSGWTEALIIVQPETVVGWHRAGFRLFLAMAVSTAWPTEAYSRAGYCAIG
jgi:hypothetical protein